MPRKAQNIFFKPERPPVVKSAYWAGRFPMFPAKSGRPTEKMLIEESVLNKQIKRKSFNSDAEWLSAQRLELTNIWANKFAELAMENPQATQQEKFSSPHMVDAEEEFYQWHRSGGSDEATIKAYRVHFNFWRAINGNHKVHQVNQSYVNKFQVAVSEFERSSHTKFKYISNMKSFFRWAYREGYAKQMSENDDRKSSTVKGDHILIWKQPKKSKVKPKPLSNGEFIAYGNALVNYPDVNVKRTFLMIKEMMGRRNEVFNLKLQDINLIDGYVTLGKTKQGTEGDIKPLSPVMINFLKEDLSRRSSKEVWYLDDGFGRRRWNREDTITDLFRRIMHGAGIFGRKPLHSIRPTAISNAVQEGGNVFTIKGLAGHETLAQTESYTSQALLNIEGRELVTSIAESHPQHWYN